MFSCEYSCFDSLFNPLSDQELISLYNLNMISSKLVMRIKKSVNKWIIFGFNS